MVEYLHDLIRASAGEDIDILVKAADAYGDPIAGCAFSVFDDTRKLFTITGIPVDDYVWQFRIPADATRGLHGKFKYCICDHEESSLCFKEAIHFI